MAYPQVVAGGADSCVIHYGDNSKMVPDGDILLMDAGCEFHGYASDITRTWPVNGRFTPAQEAVYSAVLEVLEDCTQSTAAGASLRQLHTLSVGMIAAALVRLGVLPDVSAEVAARGAYRRYYAHSVGHWLGMDTHDCALAGLDRPLEPGCVLTLEPGIYLPDHPDVPRALRGIGVRIEDDIVIREDGTAEVLSRGVPKEVSEVCAIVGLDAP